MCRGHKPNNNMHIEHTLSGYQLLQTGNAASAQSLAYGWTSSSSVRPFLPTWTVKTTTYALVGVIALSCITEWSNPHPHVEPNIAIQVAPLQMNGTFGSGYAPITGVFVSGSRSLL